MTKCRRLNFIFLRDPQETVSKLIWGSVAPAETLLLEILTEYLNRLSILKHVWVLLFPRFLRLDRRRQYREDLEVI